MVLQTLDRHRKTESLFPCFCRCISRTEYSLFCFSFEPGLYSEMVIIGVGRFRILGEGGGPRVRILGVGVGGKGAQIPSRPSTS